MKKFITMFLFASFAFSAMFVPQVYCKDGNHNGEQDMLFVNIEFTNSFGTTVTSDKGVDYYLSGNLIGHESQVYPKEFWGEFPLYFFDLPTGVKVTVTNMGPRAKAKVLIKTESYALMLDGSNGPSMCPVKTIELEIPKGQTKVIDATFTTPLTTESLSGLDRFIVKVQHANQGGGYGNPEPALIMSKVGIYCPPNFIPK